jgi:uncharacterized protein YegP (UPF0339 family)
METKKGFVNLHIDLETKQIFCSQKPYETKEEAEKGIFIIRSVKPIHRFSVDGM